jgi:Pectinacetylesterase
MRVRDATHLACASGECHCTYHKAESRVAMHNSSYEALQARLRLQLRGGYPVHPSRVAFLGVVRGASQCILVAGSANWHNETSLSELQRHMLRLLLFLVLCTVAPCTATAKKTYVFKPPSKTAETMGLLYVDTSANNGDPLAVCNDGSQGAFWFHPARSPQFANVWLVYLQGGPSACFCWKTVPDLGTHNAERH